MKRTLTFSFLLSLAFLLAPRHADAQFFKKLFGHEERRPVRRVQPRRPPSHPAHNAEVNKKKPKPDRLRLAETVRKARYRIDVLAPLHLSELVKDGKSVYKSHLPDRLLQDLGFYQGVQLAADTLNAQGLQLDVFIHDITTRDESVDALLKNGSLDSSDLIIGAVSSQYVAPLGALARKHHINFVSTISPVDGGLKENLYFSLLQPTLEAHCSAVKDALAKLSRPTTNLLVYQRNTVPVDEECFRFLTADSAFGYTRVVMNEPLPTDKLRNFLDSEVTNVVVMPIVDAQYARKLIDQLGKSFPQYQFEVYGMPSWKGMKLFEQQGVLPNVAVTFPSAFYYDPTTSVGKAFTDAFSARFGGRPGVLAYRGYETLVWYAWLLKRYGTMFNDHYADDGMAPFTRFDMKLVADGDTVRYYENRHVYLYRYQAGNFMLEQ